MTHLRRHGSKNNNTNTNNNDNNKNIVCKICKTSQAELPAGLLACLPAIGPTKAYWAKLIRYASARGRQEGRKTDKADRLTGARF